jgi:hypothetical protein
MLNCLSGIRHRGSIAKTKMPRPEWRSERGGRVGGRDFCREASEGTVPPGRRGTIPNLNHLRCHTRAAPGATCPQKGGGLGASPRAGAVYFMRPLGEFDDSFDQGQQQARRPQAAQWSMRDRQCPAPSLASCATLHEYGRHCATAAWLSSFFEKPLVNRVNRRLPMRSERFCRLDVAG